MQFKATGEVKDKHSRIGNIAISFYGIAEIFYMLLGVKQSVIWGLH